MRIGMVLRRLGKAILWTFIGVLFIAGATLAVFRFFAQQREVVAASAAAPKYGRFVRANDAQIYIQESGPADGPFVVLVHGTGAWSETWRYTLAALSDNGFHAIALDLPPFGFSERSDSMSYTKQAQGRRIVGVLDALGIKKAILIGHSFGAGPTVEAALINPDRIAKLIIVDGALSVRSDDAIAGDKSFGDHALSGLLHVRLLSEGLVAAFIANPDFTRKLLQIMIANPERATDEYVHIYQRPIPVDGGTAAVAAWLPELLTPAGPSRSEDPKEYRGLAVPTALLWGKLDTITPLDQANRLQSLLPKARLIEIDNVGHIPQIEDRQAFNRVLIDELKK